MSPGPGLHENYHRQQEIRGSSERNFGLVFATVFVLVGLAPLLHRPAENPRLWALAIAAVFAVLAFFWTAPLKPLNRLWFRFGLLLHAIVNPLVMGALFYLVVAPIGLLMRVAGKDVLRLKRDKQAATYWIRRDPVGPAPDTMKNQF